MSVSFTGGPAEGVELELQRAPMFIRVVVDACAQQQLDGTLPDGAVDALDLLGDFPRAGEQLHVYEIVWSHGAMHWHGRTPGGRRTSGVSVAAQYRHRDDVDAGELQLGDNARWRDWARSEGHRREGIVDLAERRRAREHAEAIA